MSHCQFRFLSFCWVWGDTLQGDGDEGVKYSFCSFMINYNYLKKNLFDFSQNVSHLYWLNLHPTGPTEAVLACPIYDIIKYVMLFGHVM